MKRNVKRKNLGGKGKNLEAKRKGKNLGGKGSTVWAASPPPGERSEPLQSLTIIQNMLVSSNIFQKHNI